MPILILLRHSKAETQRADDHSRVLAPRGRVDAISVREWLVDKGIVPDRVVVSTAARTCETWELASPGDGEVVYDERVYEASVDDLREVIRETADDVRVLLLVGHNPSVERLAWELDDSATARESTDRGMPTSALAVLSVDDWDLSGAVLQELVTPRG